MKIKLVSIHVDDQAKALAFYTDVLGFSKKHDVPAGEYRWLTVTGDGNTDVELVLEPDANPAAKAYMQALLAQGIPATAFETADLDAEFARLTARGVAFTMKPTAMGPVRIAIFADTCGNLLQIYQVV